MGSRCPFTVHQGDNRARSLKVTPSTAIGIVLAIGDHHSPRPNIRIAGAIAPSCLLGTLSHVPTTPLPYMGVMEHPSMYDIARAHDNRLHEWPKRNPEIRSLHIRSNIHFRFATVNVVSHVVNSANTADEAVFEVRLPKSAFMTNLSMQSDGHTQYGVIKDRLQAKADYARYKYKQHRPKGAGGRTGGVNTKLREFSVFRVAVNIGPLADIWFNLTYQEALTRRLGAYRHVIDLSPRQVVRDLRLDVYVTESRPIDVIKVPPLLTSTSTTPDGYAGENELAHVQRGAPTSAHVSYHPSVRHQLQTSPQGISGQFVMEYDVTRDQSAGEIYASPDHFVHFLAPKLPRPLGKDILFVLDVSMSMSGVKMEQTKVAMRAVLDMLREHDAFNIITFSTALRFWRREGLHSPTQETIASARAFIQQMTASRGTNVNDALLRGIDILRAPDVTSGRTGARASIMIFLMDGEPTAGIVSTARILTNVRQANKGTCSLFCLGIDKGADFSFLQKLAAQNGGRAHLIHEDADTALQLQEFYRQVERPSLAQLNITYLGGIVERASVSATAFPHYFHGSEVVVVGRFGETVTELRTEVTAQSASGAFERRMRAPVTQAALPDAQMLERLWAYLTIKRLLETAVVSMNTTVAATAKTRTLDLSLRYSFVTPITAMVIVKPDQPHTNVGRLKSVSEKRAKGRKGGGLRPMMGAAQRRRLYSGGRKSFVDNDPHFIVVVRGLEEGICFDVDGRPGDTFQLIHDGVNGIVVNGYVVGKEQLDTTVAQQTRPGVAHRRTYFGQIAFLHRGGSIVVTPTVIRVNRKTLRWRTSRRVTTGGATMHIVANKNVTVHLGDGLSFVVLRHKVHKPHPTKVDFLGFYIADGSRLSRKTHGLIGQFQHQTVRFQQKPHATKNGQLRASLLLRGPHIVPHEVTTALTRRRNMELRTHVPCWHVANNGHGLITGSYMDYTVPSLYYPYFSMANKMAARHSQPLL